MQTDFILLYFVAVMLNPYVHMQVYQRNAYDILIWIFS